LSILKIRGTNPLTLVDRGRDLKRKAEELDELIGKQVHAVQELEQEWKGKAANAARGQAYRNIERQHRFHEITISPWKRYGTALYQIGNSDTKNLGSY
jgi:hypothetical protein